MAQKIKLLITIIIPLAFWIIPTNAIPIEGLKNISLLEHRTLAIFIFAVLSWILETIPIFATSVVIITLEILTISDGGFIPFKNTEIVAQGQAFGQLLSYKALMATFADPLIMLFLGGFFLAAAAAKYRLDINLARVLIKPFGTNPCFVILGMMTVTAFFSMFMSNTACTAMMLAVVAPILRSLDTNDRGRVALALSIPFAANVGGMGTPIGTPPNAVAMNFLTDNFAISFGQWMAFAVPLVILLLLVVWIILTTLYRPQTKEIKLEIDGKFLKTPHAIIVYIMFTSTILLWIFGSYFGLKSYDVAMLPVAVFCATGIMTPADLKNLSWDVLWLIAGGFALGLAMNKTGLDKSVINSIPFAEMSPYAIIFVAALVTMLMATFMSNTAAANLILPLMAILGTQLGTTTLAGIGGYVALILAVTFAASLGMTLPISTPPNAMAHATGMIQTKQMAKTGSIISIVGLVVIFITIAALNIIGFLPFE